MKPIYTAVASAHGGREGHVESSDGVISLDLKMPRELGGPGGAGTNPEQLFAAGYAACFESALRMIARLQKKPLTDATVTAQVTLNGVEGGKFALSVDLRAKVDGLPHDEAVALVEAAHQVCPYSVATRNNVEVKLAVE